MFSSLKSHVHNEVLTIATLVAVTAFMFSIACRFDEESRDISRTATSEITLTNITPPGTESVSWDGVGRPSTFPGRPGLQDRRVEIEFVDWPCRYSDVIWNSSEIGICIYGHHFVPEEVVKLTLVVGDVTDVIGSVTTNEFGQFLAEMTLVPNEYMIGQSGGIVAKGGRGSRASIELPIVDAAHFDEAPQAISDIAVLETETIQCHCDDPEPPGTPGPLSQENDRANITVFSGKSSFYPLKVYWHVGGIEFNIAGSGFWPGEDVSFTVSGTDYDVSIGNGTANGSGAFVIYTSLDSDAYSYSIGDVMSIVATGDEGSQASTALLIVSPE